MATGTRLPSYVGRYHLLGHVFTLVTKMPYMGLCLVDMIFLETVG